MSEFSGRNGRTRRIVIATVTGLSLLLCCGGGAAAYFLDSLASGTSNTFAFGCGDNRDTIDPDGDLPRVGSFGEEQIHNAAVIIAVGQQMQIPPRGWVVAIATAMQESWLRNLSYGDRDSVGLFQQRPSMGWGTVEQIRDPAYAARKFYEHLLKIDGWETMSLTVAAQKVQISAFPNAYAKHETLATQIVNMLTNGAARAVGSLTDLRCADPGEIAASGWTVPLKGPVWSGFRTASRPSHNGVDIGVGKGTEIRAAAAGVVTKVRCNAVAPNGSDWGCHRDGGVNIRGCGWYVDIRHAGGIITRYCHQVRQPFVSVGQQVAAGDVIGLSGSTGHSSGPHLHFEVHTGGDSSSKGAIDPVDFMEKAGAPLGDKA